MALKSVPFPAPKKKMQNRIMKKKAIVRKAQSISASLPRSADFKTLKPKPVSKKTLNPSIKISSTIMALSTVKRGKKTFTVNPFAPARHPPSVASKEVVAAMDSATSPEVNWAAASNSVAGSITEGLVFLGYAYLAELAQRAEYRRIVERLATEMTRKWIRITSTTTDGADNTDKIKKINEEFDRLQVRDRFKEGAEQDGYFGRAHIYFDFGNTDDSAELLTPIGDGRNEISKSKVNKERPLVRLKSVEPVWVYPVNYNSDDPLAADWYKPSVWYVQKRAVHASRLLTFVGREVPDLLKPAYSFGGLPLTQMAKPYVDNWLRTRQSVSDLVHSFSVSGIKTNLASLLSMGGTELFDRADFFNNMRDNRGLQLLDKDTEEFFNVSVPLGTLDKLQAQSQEQMASVCGIPIVILLGITPAGLNASSEGELQAFYEWVLAYQQALFAPNLRRVLDFVQLSLFGQVDPSIGFQFEPLQQLTKKELAEVRKLEAETDVILVDGNILSTMEARERIASDPESAYSGIEASDVPEPIDEGEEDDVIGPGENDNEDEKEAA